MTLVMFRKYLRIWRSLRKATRQKRDGGAEIQDGGGLVGGLNCGGHHSTTTAYGGASLYSVTTTMVGEEDEQAIPLISDTQPSLSSSALQSYGQVKRTERQKILRTEDPWYSVDGHCPCNNRGDRIWGSITCMECGSTGMDCRSPDPEFGPTRNRSYGEAVKSYLGKRTFLWTLEPVPFCRYLRPPTPYPIKETEEKKRPGVELEKRASGCVELLFKKVFTDMGLAYTITAAISMRAIQKSNCYHKEGHDAPCEYGDSLYILLFGAIQVVFSQIPDFQNLAWFSRVAAVMSFSYSSIGLGLGLAKTRDVAFAFTYNIILLEIEIFSQPVFAAAERLIAKKLPNNGFVNNTYSIKLPMLLVLELNLLRLCFRTAYVASTTGIALLFPYFNQVLGVLGALNFWPLAIYFPVEMYIVQRKIRAWSRILAEEEGTDIEEIILKDLKRRAITAETMLPHQDISGSGICRTTWLNAL
ncbi:amino acid permease 3 [Actinidia rufa]|uniref:Amino acid permease 3 n=1 Tax=Actinidia rufa TaxID=165716 RepID=A0A7J0G9W6_9ERIC|nr:amino acid permease 3 [Actinidia rufa]